jgi:hypothetical protein
MGPGRGVSDARDQSDHSDFLAAARGERELMKFKRTSDIEQEKSQLGYATADFLRSRGWKSTSSTPGCYWLWTREWKGMTLMVSQDMAFAMERNHFEGLMCVCEVEALHGSPDCPIHYDEA